MLLYAFFIISVLLLVAVYSLIPYIFSSFHNMRS